MIVDSHCHLDYPHLYDQLDDVVKRAQSCQVKYLLTICTTLESFEKIKLIIDKYINVYGTFGIHPHESKKYTNVDAVHHYEINFTSGDTTKVVNVGTSNADYPSATIITNYEYEVNRQDELRKISLLGVEFLPQFLKEFSQLI